MFRQLTDLLLPSRCLLCRQPAQHDLALCRACQQNLPYNETACSRCARPLAEADMTCGQCQQRPPHYDHTLAPLQYRDDVRQLILGLKFQEKLRNARLLATLFHGKLPAGRLPQLLIPVPLHDKRLKERGYNQSLELARELHELTGIALAADATRRHRYTERQADLPLGQKRANIKNAFIVDRQNIASHVAIVDDVMTSGYTVDELARILKRSGVEQVDVWVMARASRQG